MIDQKTFAKYANDPAAFRADLVIDCDGKPTRFGKIMDDFQKKDFAATDDALLQTAGREPKSKDYLQRFWLERSRGGSKSTDIAILCLWLLIFATRPIRAYIYAVDRDQAKIIKDFCQELTRLNPWMSEIVDIQRDGIFNKAEGHPAADGFLRIETSDIGSSFGILPDLVVAEEVCHWGESAERLWESLLSSVAKKSSCVLIGISNAGFEQTWQHRIRELIRKDESWFFSRQEKPASWITQKRLDEQRRLLPQAAFARLWQNVWCSGLSDFLDPEDLEAAFDNNLGPMTGSDKQNYLFVLGVDLGLTRDFSAVCILAVEKNGVGGRIKLAASKIWKPTRQQKVSLTEVEHFILQMDQEFGLEKVVLDNWQAELLGQRLETDTSHRRRNQRRRYWQQPWVIAQPPTSIALRTQASLLLEYFVDRRISLFGSHLKRDIERLRCEEKSYGIRVVSPRTSDGGHGDLASAMMLALVTAHELAGKKRTVIGFFDGRPTGLSKTEQTLAALDREQALREQERKQFYEPEDHQAPLQELFRKLGR